MGVKFLSAFVVVQALLLSGSLPEDEQERPLALCEPGVNPEEQLVSSFFCDWTLNNLLWVFDLFLALDTHLCPLKMLSSLTSTILVFLMYVWLLFLSPTNIYCVLTTSQTLFQRARDTWRTDQTSDPLLVESTFRSLSTDKKCTT